MIVALAGATVAEELAVELLGDSDLSVRWSVSDIGERAQRSACKRGNLLSGNDGTGQASSQQVSVLVDGVALSSSPDDLGDEFFLEVADDHLLGSQLEGL